MFATSRLEWSVIVVVVVVGALLSAYCGCDLRTQLAGGSKAFSLTLVKWPEAISLILLYLAISFSVSI